MNTKVNKTYKFVDLFAGIGGFHLAFNLVCSKKQIANQCVFVSEIDEFAKQVYTKNFHTGIEQIIDIKKISNNVSEIQDFDFLFAGFPCQPFSNAGHRIGFEDETRGTLFFDILKILKNKQPKFFLIENVKYITNHNNGKTWQIINQKLTESGYLVSESPLILSPHEFGIAQERHRAFIVGVLKSTIKDKDKEQLIGDFKNRLINKYGNKTVNINHFLETNIEKKYFLNKTDALVLNAWKEFIKNVKRIPKRTLPVIWLYDLKKDYSHKDLSSFPLWKQKYLKDMQSVYAHNKKYIDKWMQKYDVLNWSKRNQKLEWQAGIDEFHIENTFIQFRQSGIRCKKPEKFPTLVAMVQIPIIYDKTVKKWRYLTPREAANLQSFPKNFKLFNQLSDKANADFLTYKQFGNAINVNVASYIIEEMLDIYG